MACSLRMSAALDLRPVDLTLALVSRRHVDLMRVAGSRCCRALALGPDPHQVRERDARQSSAWSPARTPRTPGRAPDDDRHLRAVAAAADAAPRQRLPDATHPRRGPVGPRLPRAAQRQRTHQGRRRRAQRPGHGSRPSTPRPASPRSTRPTSTAGSAGGVSTRSAVPASTAAAPRPSSRTSSPTSTSCCASAATADASTSRSCARWPTSPRSYARDTADITDRQNIQLHWIRIEDVPAIWAALESVGLTTAEACGDTPRVILGSPVAGVAADEIIDGTPAIEAIVRALRRRPDAVEPAAQVQDRDLRLAAPGRRPRGQRPVVRRRPPPRARARVRRLRRWRAVDQPHVRPAPRRLRHARRGTRGLARRRAGLPRLRLPAAAPPRAAEVPRGRLGRREVPRGARDRVPAPPADRRTGRQTPRQHVATTSASTSRRTAATTSGVAPTVGRVSGTTLAAVADLVEAAGSTRCDSPPSRSCSCSTSPMTASPRCATGLAGLGLDPGPASSVAAAMACTGIEFCKLAIVETKARRRSHHRPAGEAQLPEFDAPLSLHVNGCPNSCARIQVADIGLKGSIVRDADGRVRRGLPGAPRWLARTGRRVRPQATRPQGDQRRAAALRRAGGRRYYPSSGTTASRSPHGRTAPTRRTCHDAARAWLRTTAPTAATRTCGRTEQARPPGSAAAACGSSPSRSSGSRGAVMTPSPLPHALHARYGVTVADAAHARHGRARAARRRRRGATGRGAGARHPDLGSAHVRRPSRRRLVDGRRRRGPSRLTRPPRRAGRLPRHRSALPRDDRHPRRLAATLDIERARRHARPDGRAAELRRSARRSGPPTPTAAASCARCSRSRECSRRFQAWVTGIRGDETAARVGTPVVHWDARADMVKVNPIARWSHAEVDAYAAALRRAGEPAATARATPRSGAPRAPGRCAPGESARAGRWAGADKIECGIHA